MLAKIKKVNPTIIKTVGAVIGSVLFAVVAGLLVADEVEFEELEEEEEDV